jgi:Fe-S cluster assembly iron-binding protein IscA
MWTKGASRTVDEKRIASSKMWNFSPTDERPVLLTPSAIQAARVELEEYGDEGDFLRVRMNPETILSPRYCLVFERSLRPGDVVMDFDGLTVVVDTESANRLRGTVIDYVGDDSPSGPGFKFHRPRGTS